MNARKLKACQNNFVNLEEYKNSQKIFVQEKKIHYPVQLSLFPQFNSSYGLRVKLGSFYEILSQGIYGGEIKNQKEIINENLENSLISEPDVSCENCLREVKAVRPGGDVKLIDNQIAKYALLYTGKYSEKRPIQFEIFRHGIQKLQTDFKCKNLDSLLKTLAGSTRFMISLPFRVIFDIYISEHATRYDGRYYNTMTRINSKPLNKMLLKPKETLEELGVNTDYLNFKKMKFPKNVFLNEFQINSFPILIVEDIGNPEWEEKFVNYLELNSKLSYGSSKLSYEFNSSINSFINGKDSNNFKFENKENSEIEEGFPLKPNEDTPF